MADFDFSDMTPAAIQLQRNEPIDSAAGVSHPSWTNLGDPLPCSLQPLTGVRRLEFQKYQLEVSHVAYINMEITDIKNGDSFLDANGATYIIQFFELQGGGGADGTDYVFAIFAKKVIA